MKGLLIKDLSLLMQKRQTLLLLLGICILMACSTDGSFVVGYVCFLGTIMATSTISYDEYDNGQLFLMTLPVERSTYAKSKYVLGMIIGGVSLVSSMILMTAVNAARHQMDVLTEDLVTAMVFLPLIGFILALMIPVQLKFGQEKGRIVMFLVMGVIVAAGVIIGRIAESSEAINNAAAKIDSLPLAAFFAVFCAAAAAAVFASYRISCRIMENKEF